MLITSIFSSINRCVDYIRFLGEINGESIGDIEYCGPDEDPTDNVLHLHPSGMSVYVFSVIWLSHDFMWPSSI